MSHKLAKVIKYNKCNHQASESASSIKAHGRRLGDRPLYRGGIANVATGTFTILMMCQAIGNTFFEGVRRLRPRYKAREPRDDGSERRRPEKNCIPIALAALSMIAALPAFLSNVTHATPYSMTVSIDDSVLDMNVSPSQAGAFSKSSNSTVSVSTTNASGYTLSIASSSRNDGKLVDSNNDDNNTNYLSSITSATTEEQFKALDGTAYNNMWGYLPSKWDGQANTSYLPSPTTTGDVLDHTTAANTTANTYTLSIGARVDATQKVGTYSDTYVILATANGTPYIITYIDDAITGFPTDESATAASDTVSISDKVPTRPGYTFLGWCTATPTLNTNGIDTCSHGANGAPEYTPGSTWTIDQTADTNNLVLYAMWGGNYTIDAFIAGGGTMQDFATMDTDQRSKIVATMPAGAQYQLTDNRDNIKYWVAKQSDGKVWMTQNLDLCVGCTGVAALTSNNTDLNTYGGGIYATDYSMTDGVITWNASNTTTAITSNQPIGDDNKMAWSNTSYNTPYSAETGERYYYTSNSDDDDTISISCNTNDDYCKHYHAGNFYNWTEAIASSNSTDINAQYATAENSICPAGWRLPRGLSSNIATSSTKEFAQLLYRSGIIGELNATRYNANGLKNMRLAPLFLVRGGFIRDGEIQIPAKAGDYWSSTANTGYNVRNFYFDIYQAYPSLDGDRARGRAIRCILK